MRRSPRQGGLEEKKRSHQSKKDKRVTNPDATVLEEEATHNDREVEILTNPA